MSFVPVPPGRYFEIADTVMTELPHLPIIGWELSSGDPVIIDKSGKVRSVHVIYPAVIRELSDECPVCT